MLDAYTLGCAENITQMHTTTPYKIKTLLTHKTWSFIFQRVAYVKKTKLLQTFGHLSKKTLWCSSMI